MNQRNLFDTQIQLGDQLIEMEAERFAVNQQHRVRTYKNEIDEQVYLKTSDGTYKCLMPGETLTLKDGTWIAKTQHSGQPWHQV